MSNRNSAFPLLSKLCTTLHPRTTVFKDFVLGKKCAIMEKNSSTLKTLHKKTEHHKRFTLHNAIRTRADAEQNKNKTKIS
jgi:hypothetical protein